MTGNENLGQGEFVTREALRDYQRRGYVEVTERGPRGSGKTTRINEKYPTRERILVRTGIVCPGEMFETWLIGPK
tara:strand:- start:2414 stop:2638 length:225 start_codon:yes stop_codon:yes gene_type:complete